MLKVWVLAVMNLVVQRMLHEIALLLRTPSNLDAPIADRNGAWIEIGKSRQFVDPHALRSAVGGRASAALRFGADFAQLANAIVAVIVGYTVRVSDAARGLTKYRLPHKRRQDPLLDVAR